MQKVVLGRELEGNPRVIVAFQPTRGLDVKSIHFVHSLLFEARQREAAVLLVSYDLDEILALSDRVLVMYHGCIAGEMDRGEVSESKLGYLMAGGQVGGDGR